MDSLSLNILSVLNPFAVLFSKPSWNETLERRRGVKIKAKGYYRDAVRSSKSQVVKTSGLKWLVMALSVRLPFMARALALPFLTVLEPSKRHDEQRGRQHKTTLKWTSQMMLQVRRWIGKAQKIILVGDGGFAAGQLAMDCMRIVAMLTKMARSEIPSRANTL